MISSRLDFLIAGARVISRLAPDAKFVRARSLEVKRGADQIMTTINCQVRVLFVASGDLSMASTKHAYWFAEQLAARGHETMLALDGDSCTLRDEQIRPRPGVQFVFHRFFGPVLDRGALAAATRFRPTLIHAWNPQVPTLAAARAYRNVTPVPLFVHWEDDDWTMRQGMDGRPPHRIVGHMLRRAVGYVLPAHGPRASNAAGIRWILREAAAFDALTPALAQEVQARLGRPCSVVLPVTPEEAERPHQEVSAVDFPEAAQGATTVTYTGTIGPSTIQDLTIALAAIATLQLAGRNVAFVHAGVIAPRYDVPALVRASGIAPQTVTFLGHLPFIQVPALLARSDILIQPGPPTRFNRLRLPSKLQAYVASGTPTVTFATGFGALLQERSEVLKVHTADPAELANRLEEIMDSPELARALGKGGRAAAARLFNGESNTDTLLDHYRSGVSARTTSVHRTLAH